MGILLVIILALNFYYLLPKQGQKVDPNVYQAVFLDNDQVYFGHLTNVSSQYHVLLDVYYIQLGTSGQGSATTGRLVRLGETEGHGPKNEMILNRDHILFWENLTPDSLVVQQIRKLK